MPNGSRSNGAILGLQKGVHEPGDMLSKPILAIIKKEVSGDLRLLSSERVNLDHRHFSEYTDSDQHPVETPFENPPIPTMKKKVDDADVGIPTILRYFLDGSRKTYKVDDIIIDGKYLPIIAGQVGVSIISREDNQLTPLKPFCSFKNIIAFPNKISEEDLNHFQGVINDQSPIKFELVHYSLKDEKDPVDLGVAKISSQMQDLEIKTVEEMAERNFLTNDKMLIIDGPLRFKKKLEVVKFRNVVGLSKSFRPSYQLGKGSKKKDIGAITSELNFGERTSVFRITEEEKTIGAWYQRIRSKSHIQNPLQGVVKMERYAVDTNEIENGLDSETVDTISSLVMQERNVTPYGADYRWASHIYPIYMAEIYLKCSFMSDLKFKALF